MSFQNKNLYHLLGNDVEDDTIVVAPPKEIVKKTTSSKKADTAPVSADPAKAKKNKSKATGNEGAFKSKNDNKASAGPTSTQSKSTKKPFDRHSRTAKTDSKKKFKQGWGNTTERQTEGEVEGAEDAAAEAVVEDEEAATEVAPVEPPKKSLADYFADLEVSKQALSSAPIRKANAGSEDKWASSEKIEKEQESYFEATNTKKTKVKAAKEKKLLDIDATFVDSKPAFAKREPRESNNSRGNFKGARGGARGNFKGTRGGKPAAAPAAKKAEVNDVNFPSL